ncbi:MAG: 4-vinyl reductase [Thermoproteota archaeon]
MFNMGRSEPAIKGWKALDLSRIIIDPSGKIHFVSLTLTKSDTPIFLLNVLRKEGINIIGLVMESITVKGEVEVSMFLETPVKMERKKLENIIRKGVEAEKIEGVKNIRVFDHLQGFDADVYHFPLKIGNLRAMIFPETVLEGLVKRLRETFGIPVVQTILWNQGKEVGKGAIEIYKKEFNIVKAREALEMLKVRALLLGWASMEILTFNEVKKRAVIRVFDNWECAMFKGSNEPQSHFIRGVLAGFFNALFGEGFYATEVKCIAKGDSYCEFTLEKRDIAIC